MYVWLATCIDCDDEVSLCVDCMGNFWRYRMEDVSKFKSHLKTILLELYIQMWLIVNEHNMTRFDI